VSNRVKVIAAAAASLALGGCGFTGLYGAPLPGGADLGDKPYTVNIYFTDVLDLVPQSAVKVNDVAVGKVTSVRLSKKADTDSGSPETNGWTARVTVKVNGDVSLPANATAAVKLSPPDEAPSTARLANDATIPITRTGTAPEVEEVLGALSLLLNGGGLPQIQAIAKELNAALSGNEDSIRSLLDQLNAFTGTLNKQKDQIITALERLDDLAKTLESNRDTIIATLDTFPQALQVLDDERGLLVSTLNNLADLGVTATRVVNSTKEDLVTSLKTLQPTLLALISAGQSLPNSLKVLATYPFPIGKTLEAVKGDYANLNLYLDLNLGNELCGLNAKLCDVANQVGGILKPNSDGQAPIAAPAPALIGSTVAGAGK
jgi:phospholipid/cholesterol/gamma-HCH transport system substrate-binding protein